MTMLRWFVCLSLFACVSEPVRPAGDDIWACPSLSVEASDVHYVCNGAAVSENVERYVVGALVGAPGSAPPRARVKVHFDGQRVGISHARPNGAFVVDYLIPEDVFLRSPDRAVELRVDGRPRRTLPLERGGAFFQYRIDETGALIPDPPIANEHDQIELTLDYPRGDRGGTVRALNTRTGAFVEQSDDDTQIDVVIDGLAGDDIVVVVREPDGDMGGCYAGVEGKWWRPQCFCTSEERQRGACDTPDDFPGVVRVTAEPIETDAGVFTPSDAAPPE
jgi:hypothetical protein